MFCLQMIVFCICICRLQRLQMAMISLFLYYAADDAEEEEEASPPKTIQILHLSG